MTAASADESAMSAVGLPPTHFPRRTLWHAWDLSVVDEPLLWALLKYRQYQNRIMVTEDSALAPNLIASTTMDGKQAPILDLDFPHEYYPSHHPPRGFVYSPYLTLKQEHTLQSAFNKAGFSDANLNGNLQIDVSHRYLKSTHDGHGHLYIDTEISDWKWFWFMVRLYRAGLIEMGYFWWSLRRGANFVRVPGYKKTGSELGTYTYGWLFKRRPKR